MEHRAAAPLPALQAEDADVKDYAARPDDIARAFAELRPRTIQPNVRVIDDCTNAMRCVVRLNMVKLITILEVECIDTETEPRRLELWGHLSVSAQQPPRVPSWDEFRWCKEYFLGDRKAVQVLPARAEYMNVHPHVLHLYAPLERDPMPDFRGTDSTGRVGI
jgi:hypothetical protein